MNPRFCSFCKLMQALYPNGEVATSKENEEAIARDMLRWKLHMKVDHDSAEIPTGATEPR